MMMMMWRKFDLNFHISLHTHDVDIQISHVFDIELYDGKLNKFSYKTFFVSLRGHLS